MDMPREPKTQGHLALAVRVGGGHLHHGASELGAWYIEQ